MRSLGIPLLSIRPSRVDHLTPSNRQCCGDLFCITTKVGLSTIIRFLFGGNLATSVFIAGIVTMLYTGAGGLLSVAYTGQYCPPTSLYGRFGHHSGSLKPTIVP